MLTLDRRSQWNIRNTSVYYWYYYLVVVESTPCRRPSGPLLSSYSLPPSSRSSKDFRILIVAFIVVLVGICFPSSSPHSFSFFAPYVRDVNSAQATTCNNRSSPYSLLPPCFGVVVYAEARPIRIGVMGALIDSSPISAVLKAGIDGIKVAVYEQNSQHGGVAGRMIEVLVQDTNDESVRVPGLIDDLMSNASTEMDAMALMPGRNHINRALDPLARHDLLMMCPVAGDRVDFERFNPMF